MLRALVAQVYCHHYGDAQRYAQHGQRHLPRAMQQVADAGQPENRAHLSRSE